MDPFCPSRRLVNMSPVSLRSGLRVLPVFRHVPPCSPTFLPSLYLHNRLARRFPSLNTGCIPRPQLAIRHPICQFPFLPPRTPPSAENPTYPRSRIIVFRPSQDRFPPTAILSRPKPTISWKLHHPSAFLYAGCPLSSARHTLPPGFPSRHPSERSKKELIASSSHKEVFRAGRACQHFQQPQNHLLLLC